MKSKRTKATDISAKVRATVYERDSIDGCLCCVKCGVSRDLQAAHYIHRSQGGLGIPENLVTLCLKCHKALDGGDEGIKAYTTLYLAEKYPNWNIANLYYEKW